MMDKIVLDDAAGPGATMFRFISMCLLWFVFVIPVADPVFLFTEKGSGVKYFFFTFIFRHSFPVPFSSWQEVFIFSFLHHEYIQRLLWIQTYPPYPKRFFP